MLAKPMVLTNYPTVKDQLNNENEAIIAEMNPKGIAEKIEFLIENDEIRKKMENYLQQHEYGNQSEINKYIDLFEGRL